jgi:hypothetical protein
MKQHNLSRIITKYPKIQQQYKTKKSVVEMMLQDSNS